MSIRNPPKTTQLKKGRSGNPAGRPRQDQRRVSVAYLFRKVALGKVPIEVEGVRVKVPRWNLYIHQIHTMALNKNNGAARLLEQLRKQFPGDALPGEGITFLITEADARL